MAEKPTYEELLKKIKKMEQIEIRRSEAENNMSDRSDKKYRYLFRNAPVGLYEFDFRQSRFVSVNKKMCEYSGYSENEFLSLDPLTLLTEESKDLFTGRLERLLAGEKLSDNIEYNIVKKDGQEICVLISNDFIYENGEITGAMVAVQEMTEQKLLEKEKIEAQEHAAEQKKLALVGQIAGNMAHDFNNIIGIIMGNTEISLIDCKDEGIQERLEAIFKQTLRGKDLTKTLAEFTRNQNPRQEFFWLNEKIDLVVNLLQRDLKKIELIRENHSGLLEILADHSMMEHTLANLMQNSIHALGMVSQPTIIIRTYRLDPYAYIEIEDNGCGITEDSIENIFDPSFSLKGARDMTGSYRPDIKGFGYGLSNVKKYVEQHGGSVSFESKFGLGSKAIIALPVVENGYKI